MYHHTAPYVRALEDERHASLPDLDRVIKAAAEGDGGAWSALLERFAPRIRRVARAHRLAAHDVEDIVQTTWLRLLGHIDRLRAPGAVGAWLEVTARRESLRVLRHHERQRPTPPEGLGEPPPVPPVAEHRLVEAERRAALLRALDQLPERQRRVLVVLLVEPDCSYTDVARRLEIPIGSIGPTRARGLERLRSDAALQSAFDELPWNVSGGPRC